MRLLTQFVAMFLLGFALSLLPVAMRQDPHDQQEQEQGRYEADRVAPAARIAFTASTPYRTDMDNSLVPFIVFMPRHISSARLREVGGSLVCNLECAANPESDEHGGKQRDEEYSRSVFTHGKLLSRAIGTGAVTS